MGYAWSFGDTLNSSTSTATNPTYIYPDTGEYTITLIADPGSLCADTLQRTISLQFESLDASFSLSNLSCSDTLQVAGVDLSTDSLSTISSWSWSINGQVVSYLEEPDFLLIHRVRTQ